MPADAVFAEILMAASDSTLYWLVVEGVCDAGVICAHVDTGRVMVRDVGGKPGVIEIARKATEARLARVAALVDDDFDGVAEEVPDLGPLAVRTRNYDLVADVVEEDPGTLVRAASAVTRGEVARFPWIVPFAQEVTRAAALRAAARMALKDLQGERSVKAVDVACFTADLQSGQLAPAEIASRVAPELAPGDTETFEVIMTKHHQELVDRELIAGVHDLVAVSRRLLQLSVGKRVGEERMEDAILAATSCEALHNTRAFSRLLEILDPISGGLCAGTCR